MKEQPHSHIQPTGALGQIDPVNMPKDAIEDRNQEIERLKDSPVYARAMEQAKKYIRKNKKEYKRLQAHAEAAVLSGNKAQYVYAVKKMRDMLKQPYNEALIEMSWRTTNESLRQLVEDAKLEAAKTAA